MIESRTEHVRQHGALAEVQEIRVESIGPDDLGRLVSLLTSSQTKRGRLVGKACDARVRRVIKDLHPTFDIEVELEEEEDPELRAKKARMMSTDSVDEDMLAT